MTLIEKVKRTIKEYRLIEPGESVLIGLSGGPDSVALLHILASLKKALEIKDIAAAHINHNLRKTAKRDEEFSAELCRNYALPCYILNADIGKLKGGEEEAGRQCRYDFFHALKTKHGFNKIATAHTMDDQAETFLMRLMKGTSLDGLKCIKPSREDGVIRPLIGCEKKEIMDFLVKNQYTYMTDETNFEDDYLRNHIRLHLIPFMREHYNANIIKAIADTGKRLSLDSSILIAEAEEKFKEYVILEGEVCILNIEGVKSMPRSIAARVLRMAYHHTSGKSLDGVKTDALLALLHGGTGKSLDLGDMIRARTEYERLIIEKRINSTGYCYSLTEGDMFIPEISTRIRIIKERGGAVSVRRLENLILRSRRDGDRIWIEQIGGHKKIKDIFIDKKIPHPERQLWPIIEQDGEIISVYPLYTRKISDGEYSIYLEKED